MLTIFCLFWSNASFPPHFLNACRAADCLQSKSKSGHTFGKAPIRPFRYISGINRHDHKSSRKKTWHHRQVASDSAFILRLHSRPFVEMGKMSFLFFAVFSFVIILAKVSWLLISGMNNKLSNGKFGPPPPSLQSTPCGRPPPPDIFNITLDNCMKVTCWYCSLAHYYPSPVKQINQCSKRNHWSPSWS
jgi:hypothetical protein